MIVALLLAVLLAGCGQRREAAVADGEAGMRLHARRQFESALLHYRRAAQADPSSFRWNYYQGAAQAALGRHAEAVESFSRALKIDAASLPALLQLAESLAALNRVEESLQAAQRAVSLDASSAAAFYRLGRASSGVDAMTAYRRAAELAPDSAPIHFALAGEYRRLGDSAKAEDHLKLRQAAKQSQVPFPDPWMAAIRGQRDDPQSHLDRGRRLEEQGKLQQAVHEYQQALALDAAYLNAHVNLVGAYGRLAQHADAERHYRLALSLGGSSEELHNNWGATLAQQGRIKEAVASFEKALAASPNSTEAHQNLGRIHAQAGDYSRAIDHLKKTVVVETSQTPALLSALADVCVRAGQRQEAVQYGTRALESARRFRQTALAAEIEQALAELKSK